MTNELRNLLDEKTKELIAAGPCHADTKAAGEAWLAASGTAEEDAAAAKYLADLKTCVAPIDGTIEFFGSDAAKGMFPEDMRVNFLAALKEEKERGGQYCICDACRPSAEMIAALEK